jgi:hypothetical protein
VIPRAPIRWTRCRGGDCALLVVAAVVALSAAAPSLASVSAKPATTPSQGNGNPGGNGNGKPETTPVPSHGAAASGSAQGIVQSVAAGSVVLTQLDGSSLSLTVTMRTRVFVDGSRASVRDVKPGFVASASWIAGKTRVLQAFDLSSSSGADVGVVRSISGRTIIVRRSDGITVRLHVGPKTQILVDGDPAALRAVAAGYTVVFAARDARTGKPAGELRFLRPV